MRQADTERLENIVEELLAVLCASDDRLRELGKVMPAIYFKAAVSVLQPADMEARHIAERLAEELQRQGIITRSKTT